MSTVSRISKLRPPALGEALDPARRAERRRAERPRKQREDQPLQLTPMDRLVEMDDYLLRQVVKIRKSPPTYLMRALCRFLDPDIMILVIVMLVMCGGTLTQIGDRAGIAAIVVGIVVATIKYMVRRNRPDSALHAHAPPDRFSFPSGHTAGAFAIALSMFGVLPWLAPIGIGLAIFIAFARMYLGVHYPTDVIVGAAVGMTVGSIVALF
ncbi:MAG: phosphatase PAP2 family protein [Deltaproteobacteria bacterium]|nr:phosphatase PAP2 family protein [Deltaproteobacteria bacterium]